MMMMSSQGICKKREKRRKADTQPLTRVSWHPHHPPIIPDIVRYFLRVRCFFHNAILWNAPRTHNNQQIMPLIISGMSIHLWLALCPSSPAASNFPRRVRPAKKVRIYEVFNQRGGGVSLESEWSCAVTVGKMHFPA